MRSKNIPYTVPHLIDALWHHPKCPRWLQDEIWDAVNNRINGSTEMTPTYWASQLESCEPDKEGEQEAKYGFPHEKEAFKIQGRVS